jgi:hypothetical protein
MFDVGATGDATRDLIGPASLLEQGLKEVGLKGLTG